MSYIERISEVSSRVDFDRKELAYYARHILLPGVGLDGQKKLKAARVLVIGAGGLGCPVLQSLAGAGVGRITVADGDVVSISNLSRQWLHDYENCGENKALTARDALKKLNPFVEIIAEPAMVTAANAERLISDVDMVIDASDDLEVRYLIDDACVKYQKPWVHAALHRESAQMTVFWSECGSTFRMLYPTPSKAPSCSEAGVLGAHANAIGNLQALEAIKLITGNGTPLVGELSTLETSSLRVHRFQLPGARAASVYPCPVRGEEDTELAMSVVSLKQAMSIHEPMAVVDLRRDASSSISGAIACSEESLLEYGTSGYEEKAVVLVCEEGTISEMLAHALYGSDRRVRYLSGGMRAWHKAG